MRMTGRLAIASKSEHIGQLPIGSHLDEGLFQLPSHLLASRAGQGGMMVGIEATFAIDAVETAHLTVGWHEVDAERDAQSSAVNRPENG